MRLVKHLQKPLKESQDTCQHYILLFEYHKKLGKRPSTTNPTGIPGTHQLHQIGNTGAKYLNYRKFACCCYRCLHGTEAYSNDICQDKWSAYDLAQKKDVKPNLKFWYGDDICNLGIRNLPDRNEQPQR